MISWLQSGNIDWVISSIAAMSVVGCVDRVAEERAGGEERGEVALLPQRVFESSRPFVPVHGTPTYPGGELQTLGPGSTPA